MDPVLPSPHTSRLRGRCPQPGDEVFLGTLFREASVARALWPAPLGGPRTSGQVRVMLDRDLAHWETYGFGPWIWEDATTGEPVGRGGLAVVMIAGSPETELFYALAPDRWGRGLGTELAEGALAVAFGDLGLPDVVAYTVAGNVASRRIIEKVGFRFERQITHGGVTHLLFRRRRG